MDFNENIHHVSSHCQNGFQGHRSKVARS